MGKHEFININELQSVVAGSRVSLFQIVAPLLNVFSRGHSIKLVFTGVANRTV